KTMRLDEVTTEKDGIQVRASVSGPSWPKDVFNPQAAFKTMSQAAALPDLVIVGSDGKTYFPKQMSGGGGTSQGFGTGQGGGSGSGFGGGSGFSTSSRSSKGKEKKSEAGGESKNEGASDGNMFSYEFTFEPLAENVRIRSIEAILPVCDGETRRVPFTLHDVPVPFPKEVPADKK